MSGFAVLSKQIKASKISGPARLPGRSKKPAGGTAHVQATNHCGLRMA